MKPVALLIILVTLSFGLRDAHAADGPGTKTVRQINDSIKVLLTQSADATGPEEPVIEDKIVSAIRSLLDAEELGRRALQDHIKTLSPAEQHEFLELLRTLIEQSYVKALLSHRLYEIQYIDETGSADRLVVTEVQTTRRGRPYTVRIDYQLRKVGGNWRAVDVVTDGVSLVRNYRAQFNRIIAKEGYRGLLGRMQKRHSEIR